MVIKCRCTLVETPRMWGAVVCELTEIEVMAKLVAKRAEKSAEGRNPLANGSSHPNTDQGGVGIVVTKELNRSSTFAHTQGPGSQNSQLGSLNRVEIRRDRQKFAAGIEHRSCLARLHDRLDGPRAGAKTFVLRHIQVDVLVARQVFFQQGRPARGSVGEHFRSMF